MTNSKNRGWVRLHRKIDENPLWFLEPFTKAQAWVDLFLNANHKTGFINIRGNIVEIKRGQIGWSELTMLKRWTWSKNKVRRFLKWLETEQQIVQQKSALTTVITILNYEQHQQDDTAESTTEGQQKDSRRYTNKNVKNDKNEKKYSRFAPPSLSELNSYIKETNLSVNGEQFIDFYTSKGWKIGSSPMKDWKASVRNWARRENKPNKAIKPINTNLSKYDNI